METFKKIMGEDGSFPILAIIMIGLLVFTGFGYMKWGSDEGLEVAYERAQLQAYYAAHGGVFDIGFTDLRSLSPNAIPPEPVILGGGIITDYEGNTTSYVHEVIRAPDVNVMGTAMADYNYLDIISVGRVEIKGYDGKSYTVYDTSKMKIQLMGLANFLYLTDIETTIFGEVIKFWQEDTLDGWVHSNDTIAIMNNPVFYDRVTTTAPIFFEAIGFNPQFVNYDPIFEYREIYLPEEATEIRNAASAGGTYFGDANGYWASRLVFLDRSGWRLYQWPFGTPFDSSAVVATGSPPAWQAIWVDGYLELQGVVRGQVTVGAHGHYNPTFLGYHCIRLVDDIRYYFANPNTGAFNDSTANAPADILGIVSEQNITIGDTWANGRQDGKFRTNFNPDSCHIVITAAMVALGESFSFEDQNEDPGTCTPWEFWNGTYNFMINGNPARDERGDIFMHGAITQKRRGYVHRSNQGGTGYGKHYNFDKRLSQMSPPYFIEATDSEGHALFEVISWDLR
ncbi:hypothetical protein CEE37_09575 [candidate division LCP-89 bacterium B3_LCP]|uniref:DUF4900 domain-containing protein n=1 Tax=candidate division LCP-89 bacterium B3_LCP TaxID=2012998 RepID=A0A532UYI2_UNCL8|nr:MAG: hypothetical protein CEE37_09575 [candidate division LCP-89 bacterium B3_LCP]